MGTSPDGNWAVVAGMHGADYTFAVSLRDGTKRRLCTVLCFPHWSPDSGFLYLSTNFQDTAGGVTRVLPIRKPDALPALPGAGLDVSNDAEKPGPSVIRQGWAVPSLKPDTYAFVRSEFVGNLFRIPLH